MHSHTRMLGRLRSPHALDWRERRLAIGRSDRPNQRRAVGGGFPRSWTERISLTMFACGADAGASHSQDVTALRQPGGTQGGRAEQMPGAANGRPPVQLREMMVGAGRFELPTPSPPDWCANRAALRSDEENPLNIGPWCPYRFRPQNSIAQDRGRDVPESGRPERRKSLGVLGMIPPDMVGEAACCRHDGLAFETRAVGRLAFGTLVVKASVGRETIPNQFCAII